jgi:hypothetical protein
MRRFCMDCRIKSGNDERKVREGYRDQNLGAEHLFERAEGDV